MSSDCLLIENAAPSALSKTSVSAAPVRYITKEREVYWGPNDPVPLFYANVGDPVPVPVDEEAQMRMTVTTSLLYCENAVEVDCSRLPQVKAERRYIKSIEELNMSGKYTVMDKKRKYDCEKCGAHCKTGHKLAAHRRLEHPKTEAEKRAEARHKAEMAELREDKKWREKWEKEQRRKEKEEEESSKPKGRRSSGVVKKVVPVVPTSPPTTAKRTSSGRVLKPTKAATPPPPSKKRGRKPASAKEPKPSKRSPVETPERPLTVPSPTQSSASSSGGKNQQMKTDGKTNEFKCRVCARVFANAFSVAGHTRHCAMANRVLARKSGRSDSTMISKITPPPHLIARSAGFHIPPPLLKPNINLPAILKRNSNPPAPILKANFNPHPPILNANVAPPPSSTESDDDIEIIGEVNCGVVSMAPAPFKKQPGVAVPMHRISTQWQAVMAANAAGAPAAFAAPSARNALAARAAAAAPVAAVAQANKKQQLLLTRAALNAHRGLESIFARACVYCGEVGGSIHATDKHIRDKHPLARDEIYSCSQCEKTYRSLSGLSDHWYKNKECDNGILVIDGVVFDARKPDETVKKNGEFALILKKMSKKEEESALLSISSIPTRASSGRKRKTPEKFDYDPRVGKTAVK